MENITDIDYTHVTRVFKEFKMNNLGNYHDLYVQSDTLLLADIFENFRNVSLKTYGLDPAYFVSLPGLAWHACLKITGVELELITDINILLMIENGLRGGVCHVVRSYAEANNKYMDNYGENKESSFLPYLDANNLYGCPMTGKLPVGGSKWVKNVSKIDEEFIKNYDENSDIGFFLKVDIECSKELHDLQSDLPFLPQKMEINGHSKVTCTLYDKKGYVALIRNLKKALNHGLKLKKVRKAIAFCQEAWLKPYIDMSTELRKDAKNDFEKDFYKLMNNAVFGRSIMNARKHRNIKLVTDDKKRCKLTSKPNYHTTKQFSETFLAMEMKKTKIKMNVPIYIGFTILEVSKTVMWKFFCAYLKPKYGGKIELCYTDTDSFILYIKTEDFYEDIANDVEE